MNDFGSATFIALTISYAMFITDTLLKAWRGNTIKRWKWWFLASGTLNTVGTWTDGALHWLVVAAWLLCVVAALFALRLSWQATSAVRHAQQVAAINERIDVINRRIEAMSIMKYWPELFITRVEMTDYTNVIEEASSLHWPTMKIEEDREVAL